MPAQNTRTRYTRAKPIGLRSTRASVPRRPRATKEGAVQPARSRTSRTTLRPTRLRKHARNAARATARRVHQFFRHALATSAGLLVVLAVTGVALTTGAQSTGTAAFRAHPTECSGWDAPERALAIDALSNVAPNASVSASVQSWAPDAQPATDTQLKCRGFSLPEDFPSDASFTDPSLVISLAASGAEQSEDALVLESSLDGQQWTKLDSFFLTEDVSNATHGGYWRFPFPTLTRDALATLQVRARFVTVPSTTRVAVLVDGVAVEVGAKPVVQRETLILPDEAVQVERDVVQQDDEPVVSVQVSKPSRLKFLGMKDTSRTVESIQVTDPEGTVVAATYDVTNVQTSKGTVAKYAIHTDGFTKPGRYAAVLTVVEGNKEAIVTSEFSWGVLVVNMNKSVYWPGETVSFGMGVVGPDGHTICDAALTLRVVAPDGTEKVLTTEQTENGVTRSSTCGPDNVTDVADYSAEYETFDEGQYEVTLTAVTASGEYTITDAVVVDAVIPVAIGRRGSMRIYPPAAYTMALDVRPQQDFTGVVEEYVPPSFKVLKVSDGGQVIAGQQRTTIRWQVDIPHHTLKTLTYRYDAPDISPELFRLGPLQVRANQDSSNPHLDVQESRQWQIASDAVGSATSARLWSSGFELNSTTANVEITALVNSPTISSATKRSGTYALQTNPSSSTQGVEFDFSAADNATDYFFRAYVYVSSYPASFIDVVQLYDNANTTQVSVQLDNYGRLQLCNIEDDASCASPIGTSGYGVVPTSTWSRIEIEYDFGAAGAGSTVANARVNGVQFASSTTVNHANGIKTFRVGALSGTTSPNLFWDDLAINDNTGNTVEDNFPGEGSIVHLNPTGQPGGAASNTCSGATTGWDAVNDFNSGSTTIDDATTTVLCDINADFLEVDVDDFTTLGGTSTADRITLAQAGSRYVRVSASSGTHHTQLKIPSTNAVDQSANVTDSVTTYRTIVDTAPYTYRLTAYDQTSTADVDAITPTNLDSATIRFTTTDAEPDARVTTLWVLVEYVPAEGGRLWTSGFELQSTTAGVEYTANVNTPSISNVAGTFRGGAVSLRTNPSSSTQGMSYDFATADTSDDFYVRAYVYMNTRPSGNTKLVVFRDNAGSDQASIRYDATNNTLELWNEEDNAQVGSDSTTAIQATTWYMLELKIDTTTLGSTALAARINNVEFASGTVNHANGVRTLQLGVITTSTSADLYWDDVAINQGVGSTQNSYPGAGAVAAMQPDSNGDNTAWTNDYTTLDEVTPNDGTDATYSTTLNQKEDNNLESASSAGISANDRVTLVHVGLRFNVSSASQGAAKVRLKENASAQVIESDQLATSSTTWTTNTVSGLAYPITAYTRPDLSSTWTPGLLDTTQIGVRLTTDPTGNFQVSTMWLMVEYVPTITVTGTFYDGATSGTGFPCNITSIPFGTSTDGGPTRTTSGDGSPMVCGNSDGTFAIYPDAPIEAGSPIAVFETGGGIGATTVTLAADRTSTITNFEVRDQVVMLMHENAGPITNAHLEWADNGYSGIQYSVSGGALTANTSRSILVGKSSASTTYDPGGAVVTSATGGDFRVNDGSTAYFDDSSTTIGRDIYVDASATLHIDATITVSGGDIVTGDSATIDYTTGSPTVIMTGGSGSIGGGTAPSITFSTLDVWNNTTISLVSPLTVDNDLRALLASTAVINVNASITVGDDILSSGNGIITYTSGSPTITMACTDGTCNFGSAGQTGTFKVYNLTTSGSGTISQTRDFTIAGDLTVGSGTTFTYSGTPTITTNGTKQFTGTGTLTLYSLQVGESGTTATTTIAKATRIDGDIDVGAGATNGTLTYSANITYYGYSIATATAGSSLGYSGTPMFYVYGNGSATITGSGTVTFYTVSIGDGSFQAFLEPESATTIAGLVTINNSFNSRLRPSGSGTTLTLSGGITCTGNGGVSYQNTPTVLFNATQTLNCSTTIGLYNVSTSGSSIITQSTAMTVASDLDLGTSSTLRANANLTVSGGDITGNGTLTYTSGTPTVSLNGTGDFGGNTAWTFYNLDFINTGTNVTTTATGTGGITVNNQLFLRRSGDGEFTPIRDHTLKAGGKTWTLNKSGTGGSAPFINESYHFEGETSTVTYTGTSNTEVGRTNNASTNYYYNLNLTPASDSTQTYTLLSTLMVNNNFTVGRSGGFFDTGVLTLDGATADPTVTVSGTMSCILPGLETGPAIQLGSGTWSFGTLNTLNCMSGLTYETGSTVQMVVAGGTLSNIYGLYNLTIDPATTGTVTMSYSGSVANTLTVASGDSFSINTNRVVSMLSTSGEIAGTGEITGAGRLAFVPGAGGPGADGGVTISAITRFNFSADVPASTFDARTYENDVELYNTSSTTYTATCASGTYTLSGPTSDLLVYANSTGSATLDCSANNSTWAIEGNLDYGGTGGGSEAITTGSGTWTVSGNVDLTGGTLTASSGHTLVMDGVSKTLTSNSQTWYNLTLSGVITMADAGHTVSGNATLSGTVTCSSLCALNMTGTSNTLVGGGNTLGSLTINPSSTGTITLQTSDLTVSGSIFNVAADDALTIASGRTLTLGLLSISTTISGTINGPGYLVYQNTFDTFPTTGTLASDLILRMDTLNGNLTLPARTDYEFLEVDNSSTTAGRTVTAAAGTITVNDNLGLLSTGADPSTTVFTLDTNDPTFTVNGDTAIAANTTLTAPSGGALNLKGDYANSGTFTDSSGTVTLNGTATQTLSGTMTGSSDFNNLTITNSSGAVTGCSTSFTPGVAFAADATISGTYTITTAGVKVQYNSGSTYTVTNINWVGGSGNLIYFRNSNLSSGSWTLNVSGTQTVQYVDVARSDATPGVDIDASDGTSNDCSNNTGWVFATGITISGTSNSSGGTVRVAVNGSEQAETTTLAASWSVSNVTVSTGNVVVVYVEGADSAETTGVSQYDGTGDMTDFVLDTNTLTIGNSDNQTIDLTDLGGYDCDDDEDVMFSSNSGTLTVQGCTNSYTDETLSILASNTLSIGSSQALVTDNLTNAGTVTSGTLGAFTVSGNWTNDDTFNASTSTVTFTAPDTGHTINNGPSSFYNLTFDGSGGAWSPFTNSMIVTNDLTMTNGTFDTSSGTGGVTVNGNVQCGVTCGTINMTSTNSFTQNVASNKTFGTNVNVATDWTFYDLNFHASAGSPTVTINGTGTGDIIVLDDFSTTADEATLVLDNETNDRVFDVRDAFTIDAGTTFVASSTASFSVGGNWTNIGDFTDGSGTVTLDGTSQQTVNGQLTGASDRFNNLTITNTSGSDPETSPSVIFAASADTAGTLTAATAGTKLRFLAGGTYAFQNISFNGQATGTRVALRSSSTGTQWNINVAGTRSVQYTDVKDSNACGQAPDIEADDGTNANGGNNPCWKITTLTVSLSGATAALGTLTSGFVNQAGITSTVTTSAPGGYISLVKYNATLTSGSETIPDASGGTIVAGTSEFGASTSKASQTIAQWSPTACSSTASTSNATALTTAFQSFASAAAVVSSDATTLCFLASITGTQPAGSYASTATLVTTARF